MAQTPTRLYRIIEDRLDGTLAEYVARNRASMSWRVMAADLEEQTGVEVSHEILRQWFAHRLQVEVRVA